MRCRRAGRMVWADGVRALALLLVVAAWSVSGHAPAAALVVAVGVLGAGMAVFRPALQAVLPSLVPDRELLPAANALLDVTERLARLVGPALAGLLSAMLPLQHLLTLDALTFLASAAALWAIGRRNPAPPVRAVRAAGALAGILHGVRAARGHPVLGFVLLTTGVLNGAWYAAFFLLLPLATQAAGLPLAAYGLVISAYGCTNLLANLVVGSRPVPVRPGRVIFAGNVCLGLGILGIAAAAALPRGWLLPVAMASAGLAAVGGPMQDITVAVLRQTELARADVPAATRAMMAGSQLYRPAQVLTRLPRLPRAGRAASAPDQDLCGLVLGLLAALLLAPALLAVLPLAGVMAVCGVAILGYGAVGLRRFG